MKNKKLYTFNKYEYLKQLAQSKRKRDRCCISAILRGEFIPEDMQFHNNEKCNYGNYCIYFHCNVNDAKCMNCKVGEE